MSARLLGYDPLTKTKTVFHDDDDGFYIETVTDVETVVDIAKEEYKESAGSRFGGIAKIASIPMGIYMKLQREGVLHDQKAFRKWLNDPDNRVFRTRPGRI